MNWTHYAARWLLLASAVAFVSGTNLASGQLPPSSAQSPSLSPVFVDSANDGFQSIPNQRPKGIPIGFDAQWIVDEDDGMSTLGTDIKFPLLFLKAASGSPPIVTVGFNYTDLFPGERLGLASDLYETSFGVAWVRRINDRWAVRSILGMDFATDGENISGDAWQFRGGAFAIYESSPQWTWSFGAIALGREDLPVVPAVGAIWTPSESIRCDILLPRPKINYLISDDGVRQHWTYIGIGLEGNTWGYERTDGSDDQLSYGDWRATIGWESRPSAPVNAPFVLGRKYSAEFGYVFSRDLEFDDRNQEISLDDAVMFRISTRW